MRSLSTVIVLGVVAIVLVALVVTQVTNPRIALELAAILLAIATVIRAIGGNPDNTDGK
jgi:asparagine N-glycosylation enzyme membrane subunit Stt3